MSTPRRPCKRSRSSGAGRHDVRRPGRRSLFERLGLGDARRLVQFKSYQLVTRPEIRRVEDLRGKVIGIGRFGAAADWGLRLILRKLGINENKDVQIIQAGGGGPSTRLAAMEAKKLDATVLDSPQTVQARRLDFRALADGVELGIPFLQGGLVTRRAYVQAHEDTIRRLVRVIVEAIHYAKTNREAALKIMQKYPARAGSRSSRMNLSCSNSFRALRTRCPPPSRLSSI